MRGRKPKPTILHKLHNTARPKRHSRRAAEPQPVGDLHEPPDFLTEAQKASWLYAIENAPAGLLKRIDRNLLVVWTLAEDRHRQAAIRQAQLDASNELPLLVKGKHGPEPSPYLGIMNRAADIMIRCASELGFSPASRPRLVGAPAAPLDPGSPWAKLRLLQGGKSDKSEDEPPEPAA